MEKCVLCNLDLDEDSSVLNCDKWMHCFGLNIYDNEYALLNKMEDISGFKWVCPQCKVADPVVTAPMHSAATIQDITQAISQVIFTSS